MLGTIICDAPIALELELFRHGDFSLNKAGDFFQRMKFNSLLKEAYPEIAGDGALTIENKKVLILNCEKCSNIEVFSQEIYDLGQAKELIFIFLRIKSKNYFLPMLLKIKHVVCSGQFDISLIRRALETVVSEKFVVYDYKGFLHFFCKGRFIEINSELIVDLGLLAYLDDPNANKYDPQQLSERNQLMSFDKDLSLEELGTRALNNMPLLTKKYYQAVQERNA